MDQQVNPERVRRGMRRGEAGAVLRIATRFCDMPVVLFLLDPGPLVAYLFARAASLSIPFALVLLGRKAAPQLTSLAGAVQQTPFQAAAARVNLGYMMICSAMALLTFVVAPQVADRIGVDHPARNDILMWLIIGQSAPMFFGATALLMQAVDRGTFHELLLTVTTALYVLGALVLGHSDGLLLAQTFAAAQLTQAALCALLLTQSGVWPGLTALFHKQIKLF